LDVDVEWPNDFASEDFVDIRTTPPIVAAHFIEPAITVKRKAEVGK
jgi:hypothetical protein